MRFDFTRSAFSESWLSKIERNVAI